MDSARHIRIAGCINLRDLGGLPTRSGDTLAPNRLFRSGEFSSIAPQTASQLVHDLGLRRVIDLRTALELEQTSIGSLPVQCERLHVPLFPTIRSHWVRPVDLSPMASARRYLEMLQAGMASLLSILGALKDVASKPTVIHCAVGRDRTGIIIGCILDLVDVPDELIAGDYALSGEVIHDGEFAHAETMLLFLRLVRDTYGSTRAMLLKHGISEVTLAQVQAGLVL
jgi:protein-tyrosine phosphatase